MPNMVLKPTEMQEKIGIDDDVLLGCMICGRNDSVVHILARKVPFQSMHLCPDCFAMVMRAGLDQVRREEQNAAA